MAKRRRSKLEEDFEKQLVDGGWEPGLVTEHIFHPTRKWRLDFAYPTLRVGIEVHGGLWSKGAHSRPQGIINDMEKAGEAAVLGWQVIAGSGNCVSNGRLYDVTTRLLIARGYPRWLGGKDEP